jgi:putative transcription antitermination factor YqgF
MDCPERVSLPPWVTIPKPVAILSYLNTTHVAERVVEISRAEQANRVIVGLPLHNNGTEAEQTTITRLFAAEWAQHVIKGLGPNVPVHLWDERYTSKEAAARAHSKDPNRHLYGTLDAEAACTILENHYYDNGKGAERVDAPEGMYEECKQIWEERRKQQEESVQATQEARDERLRLKKEDMERDRQLEMERGSLASSSSKKKKKKKPALLSAQERETRLAEVADSTRAEKTLLEKEFKSSKEQLESEIVCLQQRSGKTIGALKCRSTVMPHLSVRQFSQILSKVLVNY